MKTLFLGIFTLTFIVNSYAQANLNLGMGYTGDMSASNGLVLEFELEKYFTTDLSLPLRADLGFFKSTDYNSLFIEIHKGFRKYFNSGFFCEQSIGMGVISNFYTLESIWYSDKYASVVRYSDGANWGFTPSVTLGGGYNITHKKGLQNIVWVRPKMYWNFGVRGINLPYSAIQFGFTHTLKSK